MLLFAEKESGVYHTFVLHKVSEGCWFPFGNSPFLGISNDCPAKLESWFGGVKFKFNFPIVVDILNSNSGGTWKDPTDAELLFYTPTVGIGPLDNFTSGYVRFLLVAEVTEMLMASLNNGAWYGTGNLIDNGNEGSKGEALSRILAVQFKQISALGNLQTRTVVDIWLNAVNRMAQPNPIDFPIDDNQRDATTGWPTNWTFRS
jgi:hypothetical protein